MTRRLGSFHPAGCTSDLQRQPRRRRRRKRANNDYQENTRGCLFPEAEYLTREKGINMLQFLKMQLMPNITFGDVV